MKCHEEGRERYGGHVTKSRIFRDKRSLIPFERTIWDFYIDKERERDMGFFFYDFV